MIKSNANHTGTYVARFSRIKEKRTLMLGCKQSGITNNVYYSLQLANRMWILRERRRKGEWQLDGAIKKVMAPIAIISIRQL